MAKNGNIHPTRIFKTPDELLKAWEDYKQYRKDDAVNWPKVQYVGKDGERKEDYPILPLTQQGFEVFCYSRYGNVGQYFDNKNELYNDFVAICSHITKERQDNQITGGMLNIFNSSITQRLNNLAETTNVKTEVKLPIFGDNPLDGKL